MKETGLGFFGSMFKMLSDYLFEDLGELPCTTCLLNNIELELLPQILVNVDSGLDLPHAAAPILIMPLWHKNASPSWSFTVKFIRSQDNKKVRQ